MTVRLFLDYGGGEDLRREHVDASFGPQSLRLTISLPRKRTYSFAIHALHAGIVPEECGVKVWDVGVGMESGRVVGRVPESTHESNVLPPRAAFSYGFSAYAY